MIASIRELKLLEFPPLLSQIPDKPKKLFVQGKTPVWNECKFLCVVGSRKYTSYGKEICEELISGLSGYPIIIVSGLALGIDSIAHRAALRAKLKTIAIPGSGLNPDVIYPSSHKILAREICGSGGCLISEFEPDFRATTWSFPQRNRIMAGMSNAVLVVEAEEKSGTLITSRLATEYNREVLTVPGSVFSKNSAGPHMLIKLGATPVTDCKDILNALGLDNSKEESAPKDYSDCSKEELHLLELLSSPKSRDELIRLSKISVSKANTTLSVLEIKGLIKETLGEIHKA